MTGYVNGMISCIIPMYNVQEYIVRCAQSVLNQSYKNVEIIIVDDGSKDESLDILRDSPFFDQIRLISKENGGVSSARNVGLRKAKGEFIFFLDADDYLPQDAFSILINEMVSQKADIVVGRDISFIENCALPEDVYPGNIEVWEGEDTLVKTLMDFPNTWNVCGKLFRKEAIHGVSFVEGKGIGEDSYFFFECALKKPKTIYVNRNVYYVSMRGGSATRSSLSRKKIDDIIYFIKRKQHDIDTLYSQYNDLMKNVEIKAHLVILASAAKTIEYGKFEKESLKFVAQNRRYYISGQSNDRLFKAIIHHYYWFYKFAIHFLSRNKMIFKQIKCLNLRKNNLSVNG